MSDRKRSDEELELLGWEGDPEAQEALGGDPWQRSAKHWVQRVLRRPDTALERLRLCGWLLVGMGLPTSARDRALDWLEAPSWPEPGWVDACRVAYGEAGPAARVLRWAEEARCAASETDRLEGVSAPEVEALDLDEHDAARVRGLWLLRHAASRGHDLRAPVAASLYRANVASQPPLRDPRAEAPRWFAGAGLLVLGALGVDWGSAVWGLAPPWSSWIAAGLAGVAVVALSVPLVSIGHDDALRGGG